MSATDDGTVELRFEATEALTNRIGTIQGGILSTMLDAAFGISVLLTLSAGRFPVTISMNASYFEPAKPGPIHATARTLRRGKTIAHSSAELRSSTGVLLAHGTAVLRILGQAT